MLFLPAYLSLGPPLRMKAMLFTGSLP
uniref:Uncharacterized protein n=1 Tax=Arundo donax TaxID=35708 RepID=A0A0A8Z5P5_ARUDO